MTLPKNETTLSWELIWDQVRHEVGLGHFQTALELCERAIERAKATGEDTALDRALCNHASILVAQGSGEPVVGRLRKILLSSLVPVNRFLAAYNLSRYHELRRETERGLFYARLALGHAEKTDQQSHVASAQNQIGNLQLIDCHFAEACATYQKALELLSDEPTTDRALMVANVGYCEVVLGHHREGFRHLFASLRMMRGLGVRVWELMPHLGLSYAYLEIQKIGPARRHAARGLELAEETACKEHIMNALYLLGESEKLHGNELAAYEHFNRLQREYYPEEPFIADFLMTTDIRKLINLMA